MINAILTHIVLPEVLIIQMLCIHKKKKRVNNLSLYLRSVSKYLWKRVYTHGCVHFLRHSEKVSKETPVLFARDHEKKERGICEQINHEFMPLFVFSFCTPFSLSLSLSTPTGMTPRFHDVPLLRRWAPRRPIYPLLSSPLRFLHRFSAKALAVVKRSHKEVILTLRFIRSKVYKGFIPLRAVDENRRAKIRSGSRYIGST